MHGPTRAIAASIFLSALVPHADAQRQAPPEVLPYFDARLEPDVPAPFVREALAAARTEAQRNARAENVERLAREVHGLRVDDHELFGTPHWIASPFELLTPARGEGADPIAVVRDFVAANPDLLEVVPAELDVARLSRDYATKHNGVRHLTFQQQIGGVDLWGAELRANVTEDGALINASSSLLPRPIGGFAVAPTAIGPAEAIRIAAADAGIEIASPLEPVAGPVGPERARTWAPIPELRSDEALTSELVFFPMTRLDVRPAWSVLIAEHGIGNTYETFVDASTGEVLRRWNRLHFLEPQGRGGTQPITFNVYTSDSPAPGSPGTPSPTGFQFPVVPRDLLTVQPGDVFPASPEHWIPDGGNETLGNNVDAHTDLDGNNVEDLPRPQGSPFRTFDFPLDLGQQPSSYTDAAVTQVFYASNLYHDVLHDLGFDEAAGNFQTDNFGLGGVGGDAVEADAQDGSGVNNANFGTSGTDGSTGRMQMFTWSGPSPDRDGDLDSEIVYHELSHGLSIRLSGGTVSGEQSGGMGEGWGDYYGLALNAEPGDDPDGVYALGAYSTFELSGLTDNYYFGIRRYPYSTDFGISPLTYADLDPNQQFLPPGIPINFVIPTQADEVHNVGEIWCNTLLQCRADLWNGGMGFASNDLLLQLVTDGLKLQPGNPNMLQARDAILQADLVNDGGAHLGDLWSGFAKRGMGASATSPSGSTTTGIVEAFDVPPLIVFEFPDGIPGQLLPEDFTTFRVNVVALGSETPTPGTGQVHVSVDQGPFTAIGMSQIAPNEYLATIPPASCFDELDFFFSTDSTAGLITEPSDAPGSTLSAQVFTSTTVLFEDDMETDTGWLTSAPGDDATTGIWERVDPVGTAAQPEVDATPDPGTMCFVTGQGVAGGGLGDNDVDSGITTLVSPVFDLSSGDAMVSYRRWFSNDTGAEPETDVFTIDVSNDGGNGWTNVEVVGPSGSENSGGWFLHEFQVSDFVAPTANMRMRFVAADLDANGGSLVEAGVDDFLVSRLECGVCQPDLGFVGPGFAHLAVCGDPLAAGGTAELSLELAPPAAPGLLLLSTSFSPTPVAGGTIVTSPLDASVPFQTDGTGSFTAPVSGGGGPASVFLQAIVLDLGLPELLQISNAVELQILP